MGVATVRSSPVLLCLRLCLQPAAGGTASSSCQGISSGVCVFLISVCFYRLTARQRRYLVRAVGQLQVLAGAHHGSRDGLLPGCWRSYAHGEKKLKAARTRRAQSLSTARHLPPFLDLYFSSPIRPYRCRKLSRSQKADSYTGAVGGEPSEDTVTAPASANTAMKRWTISLRQ